MKRVYLILIFLIGIALRVVYLVAPDVDSDQAIMGLMGRHILNGEFPIFYWGENYEGPIESYLAAITFYLFGSSPLTLALSPFICSMIFLFLIYRLAKEMFDEKVALITLSLAAASPPFLIWYSVIANGNYIENLVFGTLLLLITYRFVTKVRDERTTLRFYITIGFVSGLAWWVNFQIIHYLIVVFIFMLLKDRWRFIKRGFLYALPSFMAGSSLFWYYNIRNSWASILDIHKYSEKIKLPEVFSVLFGYKLPWVFGPFPENNIWHFNKYFLIVYGIALLFFVFSFRKGLLGLFKFSLKETRGAEILIVFFSVFSFIVTGFYNTGTVIRYYLPMYSVILIILAYFIYSAGKVFKPLPVFLLVLIISSNVYGDIKGSVIFDHKRYDEYKDDRLWDRSLFNFLESKGFKYVAYPDYWTSFKLTFCSGERIIFALPTEDWRFNKYPKYSEGLYSSADPSFMWPHDSRNFEKMLMDQGISYSKEVFGNYFHVVHSLKMPEREGSPIPSSEMTVYSNYNEIDPNKAIDRDVTSVWRPKIQKRERIYFEIDMKKIYLINKVSILNGGSFDNNPPGYELEVSVDKEKWEKVSSLPALLGGFVEKDGKPVLDGGYFISVFKPAEARYIRIRQGEEQPAMKWSIAEIFVYSPSQPGAGQEKNEHYLLGIKYFKEKKWGWAIEEFMTALESNPDHEGSHYYLWLISKELNTNGMEGLLLELTKDIGSAGLSYKSASAERRYELIENSVRSSFQWNTVLFNRLARLYEKSGEEDKADLLRMKMKEGFSPAEKRDINFGRKIEFLGYDIKHGKLPEMICYWKAVGRIKKDWTVFFHFIGPDGKIAFQNDHLLISDEKRSSKWIEGEIYKEGFKIKAPENLQSGTYKINIGIWDPGTGKRLKINEGFSKKREETSIGELIVGSKPN